MDTRRHPCLVYYQQDGEAPCFYGRAGWNEILSVLKARWEEEVVMVWTRF
jgi:hypothetical protein